MKVIRLELTKYGMIKRMKGNTQGKTNLERKKSYLDLIINWNKDLSIYRFLFIHCGILEVGFNSLKFIKKF